MTTIPRLYVTLSYLKRLLIYNSKNGSFGEISKEQNLMSWFRLLDYLNQSVDYLFQGTNPPT